MPVPFDVLVHRYGPLGIGAPPVFGRAAAEPDHVVVPPPGPFWRDPSQTEARRESLRSTLSTIGSPLRKVLSSSAGVTLTSPVRAVGRGLSRLGTALQRTPGWATEEDLARVRWADPSQAGGAAVPATAAAYGYPGEASYSILRHRYTW